MALSVIAENTSLKVNRAITGATTVNASCYVIAVYWITSAVSGAANEHPIPILTMYYGPGETVPATMSVPVVSDSANIRSATFTLQNGVEFINSP